MGVLALAEGQVRVIEAVDEDSSGNQGNRTKREKGLECRHLGNLGIFSTRKRQPQQQNPHRPYKSQSGGGQRAHAAGVTEERLTQGLYQEVGRVKGNILELATAGTH